MKKLVLVCLAVFGIIGGIALAQTASQITYRGSDYQTQINSIMQYVNVQAVENSLTGGNPYAVVDNFSLDTAAQVATVQFHINIPTPPVTNTNTGTSTSTSTDTNTGLNWPS